MKLQVLLLMLPLTFARITIRVDVSKNFEDFIVGLLGDDDHVIDDSETNMFRLSDETLKKAIESHSGARPADAFLHSSDLYQRYGWTQVHRVLKPIKFTILDIHSQPVILATKKYINNSTKIQNYNVEISQSVNSTFTNSWSSGRSINLAQEIIYEFVLPAGNSGGKTSFSYSNQWGKSGSRVDLVNESANAVVSAVVGPGETVTTNLTASRATMELEVTYEASLYGRVAVNYYNTHKGQQFWGLDVNAVMQAGNLPRAIRWSEIIKVEFYTDFGM